jgi:hypothetical protein
MQHICDYWLLSAWVENLFDHEAETSRAHVKICSIMILQINNFNFLQSLTLMWRVPRVVSWKEDCHHDAIAHDPQQLLSSCMMPFISDHTDYSCYHLSVVMNYLIFMSSLMTSVGDHMNYLCCSVISGLSTQHDVLNCYVAMVVPEESLFNWRKWIIEHCKNNIFAFPWIMCSSLLMYHFCKLQR